MSGPKSTFDAGVGVDQGAIAPTGWQPPAGSKAVVLGSDRAGTVRRTGTNDSCMVEQRVDVTGAALLRYRARLRPAAASDAITWYAVDLVDRTAQHSWIVDKHRDISDAAIVVAHLSGLRWVALKLDSSATVQQLETELPGVYIDDLLLEPMSASLSVVNRSPEPGEVDVSASTWIAFEVVDMSGANAAESTIISVTVDGVHALLNNAPSPGWGWSFSTLHGGAALRVQVAAPQPFASGAVVMVHVTVFAPGMTTVDVEYSFTVADTVAPRVASAQAISERTVRVTFSEEVRSAEATDPANYVIALVSASVYDGLPAIGVSASTAATTPDPSSFDVDLSDDMTAGATYRVTVSSVVDASGNEVAPPHDSAEFSGYACPRPAARSFELIEMIPAMNVAEDETGDLRAFIGCFQEVINLILCDIDRWHEIVDTDVAPERFVDIVLAEQGNPFFFADMTLLEKRRLVRALVPLFKRKGTDAGIIEAIRFFLDIDVTITVPAFDGTWRLGPDALGADTLLGTSDLALLYTFVIHCPVLTDDQREKIRTIADYAKAAHTHFIIDEPDPPPAVPDHWELGLSMLGAETIAHA